MLYIDMTGASVTVDTQVKYHGGGYYARTIVRALLDKINSVEQLCLIWPEGYSSKSIEELTLISDMRVTNIYVKSVWQLELFTNSDTLFLPLVGQFQMASLKHIKKRCPGLRIIITIHGLRYLDMLRFDSYDVAHVGIVKYLLIQLKELLKFPFFLYNMSTLIRNVDIVVTVSNYSLQYILKYSKPKNIFVHYQTIHIERNHITQAEAHCKPFILFVNADRREKNFLRSLDAYVEALTKGNTSLDLLVTGVNDHFWSKLVHRYPTQIKKLRQSVHLLGYVTNERMNALYEQCEFLLYTSKTEGFGLPVLEACLRGRPILASRTTSIPEVLGTCAEYIDPFSMQSIEEGIAYMSISSNLEEYVRKIMEIGKYIKVKMKVDLDFISNLLLHRK